MKQIDKLEDLTPDPENANTGTARGASALETSLQLYGAGRSIVVDRDGVVLAGNKTHEQAVAMGLKARVIETDGHELVIVRRTDLSLADEPAKARGLAYADNRVSELSLNFSPEQIKRDLDEGLHMPAVFFNDDEVKNMLARAGAVVDPPPDDTPHPAAEDDGKDHRIVCPNCTHVFDPREQKKAKAKAAKGKLAK